MSQLEGTSNNGISHENAAHQLYVKQSTPPDVLSCSARSLDDQKDGELFTSSSSLPAPGASASSSASAYNGQYTKLFAAIKDLQKHDVKISAPEFVFIGFQSSGKTSAVSQAAKMAIGVIKDGTGSRCPTRFRLLSNKKSRTKSIRVGGKLCKDEAEMIQICCEVHRKLAEKETFSNQAIEVRIESQYVPDLTFVDLPGMFAGDADEILDAKRQIDAITSWYLHETNPDGTFKYIPIVVMEPVEREHATKEGNAVNYISNLISSTSGSSQGRRVRSNWQTDALFVVNKFDKVLNVRTAAELLARMDECCGHGEYEHNTILTMMNAGGQNTAAMKDLELQQFILSTPHFEQCKWAEVLLRFEQNGDAALETLRLKQQRLAGITVMNETLERKMCQIAKQCLPSLEKQMEIAQREKEEAIASMTRQLQMCDPMFLKTECIKFGNLFMKYLNAMYNGSFMPWMRPDLKKNWSKEVSDFESVQTVLGVAQSRTKKMWAYAISPATLMRLMSEKQVRYKAKPAQLLRLLQMKLFGTAALRRILQVWICQVQYMSFPDYSDEDIMNISGGFSETIQPSMWVSIRNVVLASIHHLTDAVHYLAQMFRYKLKENADIIFECTLSKKFGEHDAADASNAALVQLLQRTLRDYKKEVDTLVDELVQNIQVEQQIAQTLDQRHCEETVLIGEYVRFHLRNQTDPSKIHQWGAYKYGSAADEDEDSADADGADLLVRCPTLRRTSTSASQSSQVPPPPPGGRPISRKDAVAATKGKGKSKGKVKAKTSLVIYDEEEEEDAESKAEEDNDSTNGHGSTYGTPLMGELPADRFDRHYFAAMNIHNVHAKSDLHATAYDVGVIKRFSYIYWTILKQAMIREITQKLANHVMACVTQHDRLADAVHVGVDRRNIQELLSKVVEKTGVDNSLLEKWISENSTLNIEQSINDLTEKELKQVYGIDLEKKQREKARLVAELEQYKRLKNKTLQKVYHIKNSNFDAISDDEDDDEDGDHVVQEIE